MIDVNFLKSNDTNILILILDFLLKILDGSNLKPEELILMLLKNKILIKLNIIMIEIFSMENFLENESANIIIERILDICIKISEVNLNFKLIFLKSSQFKNSFTKIIF